VFTVCITDSDLLFCSYFSGWFLNSLSYNRYVVRGFVSVGSYSKRDSGLLYGKDLSVSDKDWC